MTGKSNIEWTGSTWNPIVGCSIVSAGCTNCYAMKMASRIEAMQPASHYAGTTKKVNGKAVWTGKLFMAPERTLLQPLRWTKPRTIFVNSMSDLFHESVPDEWIDRVFAVMALCPQHTFQVLTKRSKRMRKYMTTGGPTLQHMAMVPQVGRKIMTANTDWPLPNVWLGISAEDQQRADERISDLLATPAAIRFVSAEPLLGPIDFKQIELVAKKTNSNRAGVHLNSLEGRYVESGMDYIGEWDVDRPFPVGASKVSIDWLICGGESGQGFRPMQIEWAEHMMRDCSEAGTAFFFKQDSGSRSGTRGRASDELWACKQLPRVE